MGDFSHILDELIGKTFLLKPQPNHTLLGPGKVRTLNNEYYYIDGESIRASCSEFRASESLWIRTIFLTRLNDFILVPKECCEYKS